MAVKDGLPATDFSRMNREYIKKVVEEAGGGSGGGGLPEITADDEGKVLTVESGAAAWATAGGGGGGVLIITDTEGTLNKTAQEISTAFLAGVQCLIRSTVTDEYGEFVEHNIMFSYEDVNDVEFGQSYYFRFFQGVDGGQTVINEYVASTLDSYPAAAH